MSNVQNSHHLHPDNYSVTKRLFMHQQTIALTFAKGNFLLLQAGGQRRWRLAV